MSEYKIPQHGGWVWIVLAYLLWLPVTPAQAALIEGSCAQQDKLKTNSEGKTVMPSRAHVMQAGLVIYEDAELQKTSAQSLKLSDVLGIKDRKLVSVGGEERLALKVYPLGQDKTLGWVDAEGLLCRSIPLEYPSGLAKRLFVDTTNAQPITVYTRSDSDDCSGECQQVRRFDWVSAYADNVERERYLIGYSADLNDSSSKLLGWVKKEHLLEWSTTLALKPQDGKEVQQTPIEGSIAAGQDNLPLQGVRDWYSVDKLLPILKHDSERKVFRIAAPRHGIPSKDILKNFSELEKILSNVDIFFVLDGTESMDSYLT